MRRTFSAILLAIYFCVAHLCISPGYAYNVQHEMNAADTYLKRGMYLEAIGAYRDVADQSTDYNMRAKAVVRIGDIYSYFLNNYDSALQHYTFVKTHYSSSIHAANAYFNSGMILYEKNRYQGAIVQFKEYLRQFPTGKRRQTAQFMIETCMKPPPAVKKKREAVTEIRPDERMRVLIHEGIKQCNIAASAPFEIRDPRERKTMMRLPGRRVYVVDARGGGIRLDGRTLGHDGITVQPIGNGLLTVNGSPYRGKMVVKRAAGGIDIINVIKLEEYLYGVVPKEMSPQWPSEALKSQAVAARTYALYQKEKNRDKDYDVYASTSSQVYGGFGVETGTTTRAVNDTRGKVLRHGGNLILAYFHANSGGVTEDAKNVWTADVPYLKSVRDDFSAQAPHTNWNKYVDLVSISQSLRAKDVDVGTIVEVIPTAISPSGRVRNIRIRHNRGETTLSGNHFRIKVDPKLIKSTLFTIRRSGNGISFYGKGYGHGVGMSQWGAYQMAKSGHSYTNILRYYYSGVEIR
jgi:stage II sporulation protein D